MLAELHVDDRVAANLFLVVFTFMVKSLGDIVDLLNLMGHFEDFFCDLLARQLGIRCCGERCHDDRSEEMHLDVVGTTGLMEVMESSLYLYLQVLYCAVACRDRSIALINDPRSSKESTY